MGWRIMKDVLLGSYGVGHIVTLRSDSGLPEDRMALLWARFDRDDLFTTENSEEADDEPQYVTESVMNAEERQSRDFEAVNYIRAEGAKASHQDPERFRGVHEHFPDVMTDHGGLSESELDAIQDYFGDIAAQTYADQRHWMIRENPQLTRQEMRVRITLVKKSKPYLRDLMDKEVHSGRIQTIIRIGRGETFINLMYDDLKNWSTKRRLIVANKLVQALDFIHNHLHLAGIELRSSNVGIGNQNDKILIFGFQYIQGIHPKDPPTTQDFVRDLSDLTKVVSFIFTEGFDDAALREDIMSQIMPKAWAGFNLPKKDCRYPKLTIGRELSA